MRTYYIFFFSILLFTSCNSDDKDFGLNSRNGDFPETGISSYNENEIPSKTDPLPNLISDNSFENENWFTCGGASIIDNPTSHTGNNMAILKNDQICTSASKPFFTTRNAILIHPLELQKLPDLLTVSFWIKADTQIPDKTLKVYLTNSKDKFLGSLAGGQSLISYFDSEKLNSEWQQIKLYYENKNNSFFLSNEAPFSIAFQLEVKNGYKQPITIYIDDVKVSNKDETYAQPEPLPDGLLNYSGNSRILLLNKTNNTISSMQPNGGNLVNHEFISTEFLNSIPQWYDKHQATVAQKVFYPQNPNNIEVIPASGTDLFRYNLIDNVEDLVYQTLGNQGYYSYTSTLNNKQAIDMEVRRTNWDLKRNRGAITVCSRARTIGFTSDDVCKIRIINSDDFSIINDELVGFNAVWSSNGRLAYYSDNSIYVADLNGNSVNSKIVYKSNSIAGLKQEVDWSPNGNELVFAQRVGGVTRINGALQDMYTISILDLNTNKVKPVLNVDHGDLSTNLSWSPDGNFIIYTIITPKNKSEIWWLEIATGKTGPLTNTIEGSYGYWSK